MARILLLVVLCSIAFLAAAGLFDKSDADQLRIQSGLEALELKNYAEAYYHWRDLADDGNPEAQYHIGWLYANGYGVAVDVPLAMSWWEKAAASDHAPSQFALGMMYLTGDLKTVKKNVSEAIKWHMKSAENGYEDARDMMRQLYRTRKQSVLKLYPDITKREWFSAKKSAK